MPVTPDRQGWFRSTMHTPEDEYRGLVRSRAKLDESPNAVIHEAIARIVSILGPMGDALSAGPGEYRMSMTAMEVMGALAQAYERRTIALRVAVANTPNAEG